MNVHKMRHAADRTAEATEHQDRARWLNAMDPVHRALHEGDPVPICSYCMRATFGAATARLQRSIEAFNASAARARSRGSKP